MEPSDFSASISSLLSVFLLEFTKTNLARSLYEQRSTNLEVYRSKVKVKICRLFLVTSCLFNGLQVSGGKSAPRQRRGGGDDAQE
jgi:hypothetical protein